MSGFCKRTRREFLWEVGAGFTGLALAGLMGQEARADARKANPLAPKPPMFPARAKSVVFLFMYGGPSHIETFDYKPEMYGRDNQTIAVKTFGRGGKRNVGRLIEPRWKFRQYGQCGKWVSDLFPHVGSCVDDIATRCLVEKGVRFIQVYSGGSHNDANWDAHGDLVFNHNLHAGRTDQPIAALLKDLKQRGLLDSTLVIWGGEFGRQPVAEYAAGTGRDHNAYGFTMWMAGGGIKGGVSYGSTDELGSRAVEDPLHVKRLHATVLHCLGLDPNGLSYFYGGLHQKLVGVEHVEPIKELFV